MYKPSSVHLGKGFFLFFFPFLVVTILGWFYIPFTKAYLKEVIAFVLLTSIFICFPMMIIRSKISKITFLIFTFLLSLLAFVKLSFYYQYGVKLSASALFVIFETNTTEGAEFLRYYFNPFSILLIVILFVPWIYSFSIPSPRLRLVLFNIKRKWLFLGSLIWILIAVFIINKKFTDQNILYTSIDSYSEYRATKAMLKNTLAKKSSPVILVEPSPEEPQTYIVVIGESTSTWHMGLYGYNRDTNPLLNEIKDELTIYEDVITPNVHTIVALDKILTLSDYSSPNVQNNASIVQLANQAGFTTYWLSNQRPVGFHESMSTTIANAADHKYFLATDNFTNTIYDEVLLPSLETVIKEPDQKKMIFIHLIGTHSDYKKRYPSTFQKFTGKNPITFIQNPNTEKIVNEYDNAILYNDYIIRNIVETIRKENTTSYVLYFSDHGDEVFDTMDLMGHNEYHGTKPMYEVPFLVWISDKYKAKRPNFQNLDGTRHRKYNLENFIHSFADISDIEFNLFDRTRSIFSPDYEERIRWIKQQEDYDTRK